MIFKSRAEKKRTKVVAAALTLAEDQKALSPLKLKLAWSTLKNEIDAAGSSKRRRSAFYERMPRALALAREAGRRALGLEAYPVQLAGATVLADGQLAEMRTGEGKTLVAAMGAALGTLLHKHVHVVTANEYLAARDAHQMGGLFSHLGLSCDVVLNAQTPAQKKTAYACDVTYGVNSELGFDYLRDNMVLRAEDQVQPHLSETLAIIDEADAILIDEARTPLIITRQSNEDLHKLPLIAAFVEALVDGDDFEVELKHRRAHFTEAGYDKVERWLIEQGWVEHAGALYQSNGLRLVHRVEAALKARSLYRKDEHYLLTPDHKVAIVDEGTGRVMADRRWSDGLHQAVEAREGVTIQPENETLASITYQHFFRLYGGRAGLTGTAWTEREEFELVYGLLVTPIPTNRPVVRVDRADLIYRTKAEKYAAIVQEVKARCTKGQPVLLGTPSVEVSEHISRLLGAAGVKHELLNARHHAREAEIISQAGRFGAVTVATNMAGRGTDIILGGNIEHALAQASPGEAEALKAAWAAERDKVLAAGGLFVLGAERHESRRIDNQLRGRSGRQGDAGESRFYLSLEDELLRVFGSGFGRMAANGMAKGEALEHKMLSRAVQKAQEKRENVGYNQRKDLMKFDSVPAAQQDAVYGWRNELLTADPGETVSGWLESALASVLDEVLPDDAMVEFIDAETVTAGLHRLHWPVQVSWVKGLLGQLDTEDVRKELEAGFRAFMASRIASILDARRGYLENDAELSDQEVYAEVLRGPLLSVVDGLWRTQMRLLDEVREGIHLQSYAQQDPGRAYARVSSDLFKAMLSEMWFELCAVLAALESSGRLAGAFGAGEEVAAEQALPREAIAFDGKRATPLKPLANGNLTRNARCPCGSGKRYKHCHGSLTPMAELPKAA